MNNLKDVPYYKLEAEYLRRSCMKVKDILSKHNSTDAMYHFKGLLVNKQTEQFAIMYLNSRNQVIDSEILFIGTIDQSAVYPREIIKRIIELSANKIIIAHNHPSGQIKPSQEDINITKKIKSAVDTIDVLLLDHIVIGYNNPDFFSFADKGLMA